MHELKILDFLFQKHEKKLHENVVFWGLQFDSYRYNEIVELNY